MLLVEFTEFFDDQSGDFFRVAMGCVDDQVGDLPVQGVPLFYQ